MAWENYAFIKIPKHAIGTTATHDILLVDVFTRLIGVTEAAEPGRRNVMSGHELFRELLTSLYLGSLSTGAKTGDS